MHYSNIINSNTLYDTKAIVDSEFIDWEKFQNTTILITGATGFIGTQIVLSLAKASMEYNLNTKIILLVRSKEKAKNIFYEQLKFANIKLLQQDINKKIKYHENVDYIIHTASNTSSKSFVDTPVETISTTIDGTKNILEFAKEKKVKSIVFLSSMEVYGEINSETPLKEDDLGKLELQNERNSYPQAKRLAENLCYSYFKEYNIPVKTARLCQIIGANIPYNDSRVFAQFARNVIEKKDIVLFTDGSTTRNYCYITDCVTAIFTILQKGKSGESYNVANQEAICSIKEIAENLLRNTDLKIKYETLKSNIYPSNCKLFLSTDKLRTLGWQAQVSLEEMLSKLVDGLLSQQNQAKIKYSFKDYLKKYICFKSFGGYKNAYIFGLKTRIPSTFISDYIYKYLPIDKKKIVFCNFGGAGYGCNPKYITEELLKNKNYKIIWLTSTDNIKHSQFPKCIKLVNISSERALYELSTAKIWVDNVHKISFIKRGLQKRKGQIYIQTWHGSLGIKKINKDANSNFWKYSFWGNNYQKEVGMIDFMISNSAFETNVYKSAITDKAKMEEFGHPRNDIFFKDNSKLKEKFFEQFNLDKNSKILLYVPTFRDNGHINCYNIDYEKLLKPLSEKFGGNWKIFIRLHPRLKKFIPTLIPKNENIIDVTLYPDIQELLAISDIAITDYSSCIFDFMLTKNPAFIYATDIEGYNNDRGFYYPLEETPFPIARNMDELIKNIKDFNSSNYQIKVKNFLKDKGCIEDGHATERVVNLIQDMVYREKISF